MAFMTYSPFDSKLQKLEERIDALSAKLIMVRDMPLRLVREDVSGRLVAVQQPIARQVDNPDEESAPNGSPTYTTKLLGSFFANINDSDSRLGELLESELTTVVYDDGTSRKIHCGILFGSLDAAICTAVVDALVAEMRRNGIGDRTRNRFWSDAHSGVFSLTNKVEYNFHLCVTVLEVLEKSGCDPAHLYKWERSLEQVTSSALDFFKAHPSDQAVGKIIHQVCNRRLAPLVRNLSCRQCRIVLANNPYWQLAKSLFALVAPDSKTTKLKDTIPWQLFISLCQEWLSQPAEQRSWVPFTAMRGNLTLFSLISHYLGHDQSKVALDGTSPNSIGLKVDFVLPRTDMTISIEGNDASVRLVHTWLLAAAWPYVVRVLSAGMAESVERIIKLPSVFPPETLDCILSNMYGVPKKLKTTAAIKAHMEEYEAMYGFKALFEKIELVVE
jgi:hypothetical protein